MATVGTVGYGTSYISERRSWVHSNIARVLMGIAVAATGCQAQDNSGRQVREVNPVLMAASGGGGSCQPAGAPTLKSFAVYAAKSIRLDPGVVVAGGNVGVKDSSGPFLFDTFALSLMPDAKVQPGTSYASSVLLDSRTVAGDIGTNRLVDRGGQHGKVTPWPPMGPLPVVPGASFGTKDLVVENHKTVVLAATASYRSIRVKGFGVLRLKGGLYQVGTLSIESQARLEILAPVEVRIKSQLDVGSQGYFGPAKGVTLTARDLFVAFSGTDANGTWPVRFDAGTVARTVVLAPNATIHLQPNVVLTGALVGKLIWAESRAKINFENGLSGCVPPCGNNNPWDDGNACTLDTCNLVKGPVHAPVSDGTVCDDASACTKTDLCVQGACVGSNPVVCPTPDQCHLTGLCDAKTGLCSNPAKPDDTACNDGNACTQKDACEGGVCVGSMPKVCVPSDICHEAGVCDGETGLCSDPPKPDHSDCGDGNACNGAETCTAGVCQPGDAPVVDDGNPCTTDSCVPETGVKHEPTPPGSSCTDLNICNGMETCDGMGSCLPGVPPSPPIVMLGNPCKSPICTPGVGWKMVPEPVGQSCSDGNLCNGGETCDSLGSCVAGQPPSLSDGNPCTIDTCDPVNGLSHKLAAQGTTCGDGRVCNSVGTCEPANAAPVVEAGPDQTVALPATVILDGSAHDDDLPAGATLTYGWVQVSGPGVATFDDASQPSTTARFPAVGAYTLRLTVSDSQLTASDDLVVNALPRTGSGSEFPAGTTTPGETLVNLVRDGNGIHLDNATRAFGFIWVAVSTKGTVVKIDTQTGQILGEYLTAPSGQPQDPSRTTVDHNGNVWATNRAGNSVLRIGLVENEQCLDRNGNGVIDTSKGQNDIKPWTNASGADTNGGVSTAQDECIINYVRVSSPGTRHVSVDSNNDVWVSGTGNRIFNLIDGRTGVIKRTEGPVGYGGYGGLIDANGVIWSARPLLRWNTANPLNGANGTNWNGWGHDSYGLCIDPQGQVWNTSHPGNLIYRFAPDGTHLSTHNHGAYYSQGCVADRNGHIWVAHSLYDSSVGHLKPDGSFVGNVSVGSGPTGVAVDAAGKIWATNYYGRTVSRIDPTKGPLGPDGITPVGAVDFTTVDLGGNPYDYSDMTGSTLTGAPENGTWSFVYDSTKAAADWGKVAWSGRVCGDASLKVTAASSPDGVSFGAPVQVGNEIDFDVAAARYLKVAVAFHRSAKGQSPTLYGVDVGTSDFVISPVSNLAPVVSGGPDRTVTLPGPFRVTGSACDDGRPLSNGLAMTWTKVSGPGTVTFATPNLEATDVSIAEPGEYVLRLTASDSALESHADVVINVLRRNGAPVVSVVSPVAGNTPAAVTLSATVSDDALPEGGTLATLWTQVSGPVQASIAAPAEAITSAIFPAPGTYVLRLTATDGQLESSADVTVVMNGGPSANLPPTVAAGENQTIPTGSSASLAGVVTDDGLPAGGILVIQWTKVSGPGDVTFAAPTQPATTAAFSTDGVYVLRLEASDGELTARAEVSMAVGVVNSDNRPPVVSAGPNRATTLPLNSVQLNGTVTDDGLPLGVSVEVSWTKVSGPGTVLFANPNQPESEATFSAAGTYVLRLSATDSQFVSWSETSVLVSTAPPVNVPPTVGMPEGLELILPARTAQLAATVSDTTIPAGGALDITWRTVSGPSGVVFGTPKQAATNVTFPNVPGAYVLGLTASDSQLATTRTMTVVVRTADQANAAPTVDAGPNITVTMPADAVLLKGWVTDDGLPTGVTIGSVWNQISGPAEVTFADRYVAETTALFPVPGDYELELSATDSEFLSAASVFVRVLPNVPNRAPVVTVNGPINGILGSPIWVSGSVRDDGLPANSTLAVSWKKVSGPGDVSFEHADQISTLATFTALGSYILELQASDSVLASAASLTVAVVAGNAGPVVSAGPDKEIMLPQNAVVLDGSVSDDGLPVPPTLSVSWSKVSGPGTVTFTAGASPRTTAQFSLPGRYILRLTGNDGESSASDELQVLIWTQPGGEIPTVEITAPSDDGKVTALTRVEGSALDDDLAEWTLDYRPSGGTEDWIVLHKGTTPVTTDALADFDPTTLLNGMYELRLQAVDLARQVVSTSIHVVVEGNQKVGNFTVSFKDLSVPVAGIPIEVIRTYDSRNKSIGDFGVGWNLSVRTGRVERNHVLGKSWEQTSSGGLIPQYCLVPSKPGYVTITLADNKVYRFRVGTTPSCNYLYPIQTVDLVFTAEAGTKGSLTALDTDTLLVIGGLGPAELLDFDLNYADPHRFQLTTEDGTAYVVSQELGVESVRDTNGNLLTITRDGILHSSGKSVTFARDGQGRITRINDPMGQSINYEYDTRGDLRAHVDRVNNRTTFAYNQRHDLLDIFDPLGNRPVRNEYDDSGRLVRHIDALGKTIEYNHDISAQAETITDRLGGVRVLEYDADGNVVRETDPEGHTITRTFDARDNRTSETDANGNTTSFVYDSSDNLLEQVDPLGNRTKYSYNSRHQILTTTDPLGGVTTNVYDGDGNLASTRDPLGNVTAFTYDGAGNQLTRTDPLGNVTSYAYDGAGNRIRETSPLGNVTTYTYDANGNRVSETRTRTTSSGIETLVTSFQYDANGRVIETHDPDGSITKTTYDGSGRETSKVDKLGRTTAFQYDDAGRLVATIHPDGSTEQSSYDAEGRRTASIDTCARTTQYEYDGVGRLLRTTYPDGATSLESYDAAGRLVTTTDALGSVTRFEYDVAGRKTRVIDALGNATSFGYDASGHQTSVRDARGNVTTYEYDAANHRVRTVFPDGTSLAATYDTLGRKVADTDQAGNVTRFAYDAIGRLLRVTDALAQVTEYEYDELGNRTSQTDANGHETRFEYDQVGRQLTRILSDGKTEAKTYDAQGNLLARMDFAGRSTAYSYDQADRLTAKRYPDNSTVGMTYNCAGQRATVTDARGVTSYTYDTRNRPTAMTYPDGRKLSYGYDLRGNRTTLTAQVGASVLTSTFELDALGRMSQVKDPAGRLYSYNYDQNGNRAGLLQPNGVATTYTYDTLNRLIQLTSKHQPSGITIQSYDYSLGPTGIRTSIAEQGGVTRSYQYDALYRLTSEAVSGTGTTDYAKQFTYDAVGNRLSQVTTGSGAANVVYTYDNRDRLLLENATAYGWDDNGNLTSKSGDSTYTWDFEDRLIRVQKTDGTVVEHQYDVDGTRVRTAVTPSGGNAAVTQYLVDTTGPLSQVVAESDGDGNVSAYYVRGNDRLAIIRANDARFYHADGLGSVRLLTDQVGQVTDSYSYSAFGETTAHIGEDHQAYQFAGEEHLSNIGLYYNRARWMEPRTSRFVSTDPVNGSANEPRTLHRYSYAANSPATLVDPSGCFFSLADVSISMAISGILRSMAVGAMFGGVVGAGDAYFDERDIVEGVIQGAVAGALLGPVGRIKALRPLLTYAGMALAASSAMDAYLDEDYGLALYRGVLFVGAASSVLTSFTGQGFTPGPVKVYRSIDPRTGQVVYVGITENLASRAAAHFRTKGISIAEVGDLPSLSRADARGVEQALINYYGLGKNGGSLLNMINSISPKNPQYATLLSRGVALLKAAGYPDF